ncbi:hypothetical protein M413DRAFT_32918 [Hebeloma cylindrosporum]|uniref:Secreted protein n=1 Tax=Hebeloma cylindrosporum TaxID=76867 RepID=A0A0C2Y1E9_HEBCY|nr:hypothetical protein M413DRAFT_32918 [Hebeloma cylindrosporum h7]
MRSQAPPKSSVAILLFPPLLLPPSAMSASCEILLVSLVVSLTASLTIASHRAGILGHLLRIRPLVFLLTIVSPQDPHFPMHLEHESSRSMVDQSSAPVVVDEPTH